MTIWTYFTLVHAYWTWHTELEVWHEALYPIFRPLLDPPWHLVLRTLDAMLLPVDDWWTGFWHFPVLLLV